MLLKHNAMRRTVHGFNSKLFFFGRTEEHVTCVFKIVTTAFPKLILEHGRSDDLSKTSVKVLVFHQVNQPIEYSSTMRKEKGTTRCVGVKEKQLLMGTYDFMVSLLKFFNVVKIFLKFFFGRKSQAINSL